MSLHILTAVLEKAAQESKNSEFMALRRDLTDDQYADWFLEPKMTRGRLNPRYAMNDFVLFRNAYRWPLGTDWIIDADSLNDGVFSLSDQQAVDLIDMAREGLTDGYVPASWFAKVAAIWHIQNNVELPAPLFIFLQESLFDLKPKANGQKKASGRKKADQLDRDIVIRNLMDGLLARNANQRGAKTRACWVAAAALGRRGVCLDYDAVRKIFNRLPRTEREKRLWSDLSKRWHAERIG